jgi:hypothetical protein
MPPVTTAVNGCPIILEEGRVKVSTGAEPEEGTQHVAYTAID